MPRTIKIEVVPQTVPTTGSPFHSSATHKDALGMPVVIYRDDDYEFPFHPTPCCGAAASCGEWGMYCKRCYGEVDFAYGNVPVEPLTEIAATREGR